MYCLAKSEKDLAERHASVTAQSRLVLTQKALCTRQGYTQRHLLLPYTVTYKYTSTRGPPLDGTMEGEYTYEARQLFHGTVTQYHIIYIYIYIYTVMVP